MNSRTTRTTESAVSFGVSARLVSILGQHLIRDNTVGLMELIKNGYDADADEVSVEMYDLNDPDRTLIVVQDNGDGMTREVLTGPWLTVAHGHKEASKNRAERSGRGRIPLGEKGVGRFAAHKLGRRLKLTTRPRGYETELVLEIDWDTFDSGSLSEVELKLTERPPLHFSAPDAHGTRLEMTGARDRWQTGELKRLQASLVRLTHPRFGVPDFRVILRCPEYVEVEDLSGFDITERYQFRLTCEIDDTGAAWYEYRWRDENLQEHVEQDVSDLWQIGLERQPACGPLRIQLSAWLLREKTLNNLGLSREHLKILGGISIYRDGFRILPYGDEGDDWLNLDARRVNDPSGKFGNRQLVGAIAIDQVHNRTLVDKTNREGLQENQAYGDLKRLTLAALQLLENLSAGERTKNAEQFIKTKQQLETNVQKLEAAVARVQVPPVQPVVVVMTDDEVAVTREPEPLKPNQVVLDIEELEEIKQTAREVNESALKVAAVQDEERDAFLQLIGAGLAAERFVHEMDRQMDRARDACATLRVAGLFGGASEAAKVLDVFVNSLRNEMRVLGKLRYVQRSQRAREVSVRTITEYLLLAYHEEFDRFSIKVDPWLQEDFVVVMSEAALAQVIDNVLDNAVYWLKTVEPVGGRRLRIDLDAAERTLTISNNGPRVSREIRGRLFDRPFVSTKQDGGHGLGMYLSAEIMRRAGGNIAMMEDEEFEAEGAGFQVTFPADPKEGQSR